MGDRKKIILLMWHAGGAHLSVCRSLQAHINQRGLPWDVSIVHFIEDICQNLDPLQKYLNYSNEALYNFLVRHRLFGLVSLQLWAGNRAIRKGASAATARTCEYMQAGQPDYVVSAVHHFNGIVASALKPLGIPFGVIPTEVMDLEETPLWFSKDACRHAEFFSVALEDMAVQGRRLGCTDNCMVSGGLVIKPQFFESKLQSMSREQAANLVGLDEDRFTILVLMGGEGSKGIFDVVQALERGGPGWQLVACCGRDNVTRERLVRYSARSCNRIVPLGFTEQLELYMKAAHLVITKPGPTTIWEALVSRTPLLIDAKDVIIWEQPQVEFVQRYKLGNVVFTHDVLLETVHRLMRNEHSELEAIRARMAEFPHSNAADAVIGRMQRHLQ